MRWAAIEAYRTEMVKIRKPNSLALMRLTGSREVNLSYPDALSNKLLQMLPNPQPYDDKTVILNLTFSVNYSKISITIFD